MNKFKKVKVLLPTPSAITLCSKMIFKSFVPFQQCFESHLESRLAVPTLGFRWVIAHVHMLHLGLFDDLESNIGRCCLRSAALLHLGRRRRICHCRCLGLVTRRRDRSMIVLRTSTDSSGDRHRRIWVLLAPVACSPTTTSPHMSTSECCRASKRHGRGGHCHERDCKHWMDCFIQISR